MQPLLLRKGKKYYIFRVCVCSLRYPACNAHAPYCHLRLAWLYSIFSFCLTNGTIWEQSLLNTKCLFWFPPQRLAETILILWRNERKLIKTVGCIGLHVKYPLFLSDLNDFELWPRIFEKEILKHQISWKSVQWEPSCPTRTDRRDEANRRFSKFCEKRL